MRVASRGSGRYTRSLVANLLSLLRVPLGLAFLLVAERTGLAMAILCVAAATDVLDGWMARRRGQGPPDRPRSGDWLDPLCDKLFVAAVLVGIYLAHRTPPTLLLLIVTREILQGISVVVYRVAPSLRGREYSYRAHPLGKAATIAQFVTAGLLLLGRPEAWPLAFVSALLGTAAVMVYLNRARVRPAGPAPL